MDKTDKKGFDFTNISRGYENTVGQYPIAEAALGAGVGGVGGYLGGNLLAKQTLKLLLSNKSPEEREQIMQKLQQDGTFSMISGVTGALGGIAGAAYPLYQRGDTSGGTGRWLDSVMIPGYNKRNPERIKALGQQARQTFKDRKYSVEDVENNRNMFSSGRQKTAAVSLLDDPFVRDRVPVGFIMDLIQQDPFLTMTQKQQVNGIIESAEGETTGLVSGKDMMRGALRAGVGLATGYAFGQVTGKLFSLPSDITKRLSTAGAIAGGILNTGIFREI